jgi:hypothetical protein
MPKTPDFLYHYTVGAKLALIAQTGALIPKGFEAEPREKPVLWLSENPQWEPTANKVVSRDGGKTFERLSLQELQNMVGIFRFRLDTRKAEVLRELGVRLVPWVRIGTVAHISPRHMAAMVTRGMSWGATPTHWWGCLDPLPLSLQEQDALTIEAREPAPLGQQQSWQPVTMEQAIESFRSRGIRVGMTTATATPAARNV